MGKRIAVLGGGIGGVIVAGLLRKKLGKEHAVILIDKSNKHCFHPASLGIMTGRTTSSAICKNFGSVQRKGIKFVNGEVKDIDPENRIIYTDSETIDSDYVVVALGAQLAPEKIPGLAESGLTPYELDGAEKLRSALNSFKGGKVAILVSSMPYKCPAAPYETAFLVNYMFERAGIRNKTEISIYTPEGLPMPTAGPELGELLKQFLARHNISFNPLLNVSSVDNSKKQIIFADGRKEDFDLLIYIPPHKVPDPVEHSSLAGPMGWIPVDMHTLKTNFDNIYAIGDVTAIKLPGSYKPDVPLSLPKAGVFAHEQAKIVAQNIAAEINGTPSTKEFDGRGGCFMETGNGKAAFASGEFYQPSKPNINFKPPSKLLRFSKIVFEKYWLWTKP